MSESSERHKKKGIGTGGIVGISFFYILLGLVMIFFPKISEVYIIYAICAVLIVLGILLIVRYFRNECFKDLQSYGFSAGVLAIVAGVCIMMNAGEIAESFGMVLGICILLTSVVKLQDAVDLNAMENRSWFIFLIIALAFVAASVLILLDPMDKNDENFTYIYYILIADGAFGLFDTVYMIGAIRMYEKWVAKGRPERRPGRQEEPSSQKVNVEPAEQTEPVYSIEEKEKEKQQKSRRFRRNASADSSSSAFSGSASAQTSGSGESRTENSGKKFRRKTGGWNADPSQSDNSRSVAQTSGFGFKGSASGADRETSAGYSSGADSGFSSAENGYSSSEKAGYGSSSDAGSSSGAVAGSDCSDIRNSAGNSAGSGFSSDAGTGYSSGADGGYSSGTRSGFSSDSSSGNESGSSSSGKKQGNVSGNSSEQNSWKNADAHTESENERLLKSIFSDSSENDNSENDPS